MNQYQKLEMRFKRGQASAEDIQAVIDEILVELRDPESESSRRAQEAGLDPQTFADARVSVSEEQGIEPILTTIVVGMAVGVGTHIGKRVVDKLWDDVIGPSLRRRLGGLAVGDRES